LQRSKYKAKKNVEEGGEETNPLLKGISKK